MSDPGEVANGSPLTEEDLEYPVGCWSLIRCPGNRYSEAQWFATIAERDSALRSRDGEIERLQEEIIAANGVGRYSPVYDRQRKELKVLCARVEELELRCNTVEAINGELIDERGPLDESFDELKVELREAKIRIQDLEEGMADLVNAALNPGGFCGEGG